MSHRPSVTAPAPIHASEKFAERGTLASLGLATALSALGASIANVALPDLADAFGAPFRAVQWIVIAYSLATTVFVVGAGWLGDAFGRRRLLVAGIALFTLASALSGLAPSLSWLLAGRALQGMGAAVMMALAMAMVGDVVTGGKTGSAMGFLGTMSAIGTSLGPSLGGLLLVATGWRSIFLVGVPFGLVGVFLVLRFLPADRVGTRPEPARPDLAGTGLLAGALSAYALAATAGEGGFGLSNALLAFAALIGAGLFVLQERRSPAPLVRLDAFADPEFSSALAANVIVFSVIVTTLVAAPFYLSISLGLSVGLVGAVMTVGPVTSAVTGVPAGKVVDWLGARRSVVLGLAQMALGALALALLPGWIGVAGYVAALLVLTPGYQLFQAANNTAVMAGVPADRRGVMAGMLALSRNLGLITGAAVMGALFATVSGLSQGTGEPDAVAAGMRATFLVAAALIGFALVLLILGRTCGNSKGGGSAAP